MEKSVLKRILYIFLYLINERDREYLKTDLEEILAHSTGVIINRASDGMRVSLRGMSDDTTHYHGLPGSTPTVAINADGVYSNRKNVGGVFDFAVWAVARAFCFLFVMVVSGVYFNWGGHIEV